MLTRVPEEILLAEKALDFGDFLTQEPLKFQFCYGQDDKVEISNTIYLEDGNTPSTLYLEVFNDSEEVITFKTGPGKLVTVQAGGTQAASAKKCHFQLRWEKDLGLKPDEIEMESTTDWQVNYDEDTRFFSIYFLRTSELKLNPSEKIKLGFLKLTANNRTVKSSNVELLYGGKGLIVQGEKSEELEDEISSRIAVSVINYPGKTKIPLQFRVLGSNRILNDATTQNNLTLKVINSPLSSNARPILLLDSNSKFIVSFEQGTHKDALVATDSELSNVSIAATDTNSWTVSHTANSTQWTFTPKIKQLTAGQGIELSITNLVTSSASGFACIYIDYQNIGSYPDGRLVIPIEKMPLLYSGNQVGVGTKAFDYWTTKFKVNGDIVLGKDEHNRRFRLHTRTGESGEQLQIVYDNPSGDWNWAEGITLKRLDGKVGIGTTDPKAKLHVNGGAVIKDNVGIGTEDPKAKLHVNGGDALISGKVGIGMSTLPKIHLAIGDDDTGLQQQGDGELAIYTNNSERVRVNASGNVGIGTNNPTAKLHVNGGDALISGKVGIGTTDPKAKLHVNGGDALISGKVGIGTTDPQAKLHVEGSSMLGPKGTIINRMICGQVFLNTVNLKWEYKSFSEGTKVKMQDRKFKIYYGFDVKYRQDLVILATVIDKLADCTVCVQGIYQDHCVLSTKKVSNDATKLVNFSFMIIHYAPPATIQSFSQVEDSALYSPDFLTGPYYAPIENYNYPA